MRKFELEILESLKSTVDTNQKIADRLGCSEIHVRNMSKHLLTVEERSERRSKISKIKGLRMSGANSPCFKTGLSTQGYRNVLRPDWYTGSKSNRILEHVLVACQSYGITELPKGCVVHHIDGGKLNNEPLNLIIVSHGNHRRIHAQHSGNHVVNPSKRTIKVAK